MLFFIQQLIRRRENFNKEAGIPAVAFSPYKWHGDAIATFNGWIELLGEVLNEKDHASGITKYGREIEETIRNRIKDLKDEDKPRAFIYLGMQMEKLIPQVVSTLVNGG